MKPSLGTFHDGSEAAVIDLPRLLETRMLIQANSGAGKSWAIRRLLEQTAGQVQQFVIDPEGEFSTLRERHDYVIAAAHDGDALAHPRTAQLLARRLLETGVSAILDIYDLKAHERQAFVRLFCEELVNAPKALWQPALVVLDEAHVFCPEAGKAESAGAVIDLATRGRKRGFALIAATQRLAKLHKDTAAELLNKLIGRTGLDVDVKRAADELGMTHREAVEKLRLDEGEFFAFGPALSRSVRRLKVGPVQTTHPKAGDRTLREPPKPTAAIKAVLPKLSDLPKEAEAEARSIEELKRELANTRRELTHAKNAKPGPSREDLQAAEARGFERGREAGASEAQRTVAAHLKSLKPALHSAIDSALSEVPAQALSRPVPFTASLIPRPVKPAPRPANGDASLGRCESKILTVLAQHQDGCEIGKLTLLAGYRKSGGFLNSLSTLRTMGLIEGANTGSMRITEEGMRHGPFPELPRGDELLRYWIEHPSFGVCERKILAALSESPKGLTAEEICERTSYAKSGGFLNSLSALRTAGVLVGRNTETMRLNETITG